MKNASVFVVGSLHYDIVLRADHIPAPDETVLGNDVQYVCGGKGGNQAVAASQHGAVVAFAGMVGKDYHAELLLKHLRISRVDTTQIQTSIDAASGMSVAIVDTAGDYGAVVASGANQAIDADAIDMPNDLKILILQNEIAENVNIKIAQRARSKGAKIVLNAAPMRTLPDELIRNVDILIVNRLEAETLLGQKISSKEDALNALKAGSSIETIIVTLGRDGLCFKSGEAEPNFIAPRNVAAVSSHGAGDCFVGAFCARLAMGHAFSTALDYASCAAALHVSTPVEARGQINAVRVYELLTK